jgi:hypothetical protein
MSCGVFPGPACFEAERLRCFALFGNGAIEKHKGQIARRFTFCEMNIF